MIDDPQNFELELTARETRLASAWFMNDARAVFFLDEDRRVLLMNAFARSLVENGEYLQLKHSVVHAETDASDSEFRKTVERSLSTGKRGWGQIRRAERAQDGAARAGIYAIAPVAEPAEDSPAAILCFLPPLIAGSRLSIVLDQFHLTQAEKEIAYALIDEYPLSAIAEQRGVRPSTIKSHVKNIYDKTGTTGRIQFMSQFMMMAAIWV